MIKQDCEQKIIKLASEHNTQIVFLDLFRAIANDARIQDLPNATLVMPMYDENSGLEPGDYAPEIHFVCRRVESLEESR